MIEREAKISYKLLNIIYYPEENHETENEETIKVLTLLQNDDNEGFISYLSQNPSFDIYKDIELTNDSYYYCISQFGYFTPIYFCCLFGSINCFEYLYLNKCEITEETLENAIACANEDIIHILEDKHKFNECLETAVEYHHNNIIEWLLLKYGDECQHVPLPTCLQYFNYEAFLFFLHNGADINESNGKGCSVLHWTSEYGFISLVKYLIEDMHFDKEAKDGEGKTALHIASENNVLDVVKYLIEKAYVDKEAKDKDDRTALHYACQWNRLDIVKYLIEEAHIDKYAKDNLGKTPLHVASEKGNLYVVKYLIEEAHIDKYAKDCNERTALHIASGKRII